MQRSQDVIRARSDIRHHGADSVSGGLFAESCRSPSGRIRTGGATGAAVQQLLKNRSLLQVIVFAGCHIRAFVRIGREFKPRP